MPLRPKRCIHWHGLAVCPAVNRQGPEREGARASRRLCAQRATRETQPIDHMSDLIFPSLPSDLQLLDLFRCFPHSVPPLLEYHDRLLRDSSPLTVAERELIAAFVSALNSCDFCHGAHAIAASVYGIDEQVLAAILADPEDAPFDQRLKPILAYVKKLTLTPATMTPADAKRVYDAGWDERALFDAISVCALFNMMNRIVLGAGILEDPRLRPAEEVEGRRNRMGEPGLDPRQAEPSYSRLSAMIAPPPG